MYPQLNHSEERVMQALRDYVKTEADNTHQKRMANTRQDLDQLLYEVDGLTRKYPDDQDIAHIYSLVYRLLY